METSNSLNDPTWVAEVLRFWFGELTPKDWFKKQVALDDAIRARFLTLHDRIVTADGDAETVGLTAPATLAAVIVLDQFSRNMFRDTPRAFASDHQALRLTRSALDAGLDGAMTSVQKQFLYLPLEHSENASDQVDAVRLLSALGDPETTRYALAHQAIIERFGRFPHRNAILGRASTADEIAFLGSPSSSF